MELIIPDELVAHVARQNSIVFAGAGLSTALGLPTWPQLVPVMIHWCEKHRVELQNKADIEHLYKVKADPVMAANALRRDMGEDNYRQFFADVFLRPDLKPTEVHQALARLPFVGMATSNYDPALENSYREAHPAERFSVFTYKDHQELGTALNAKRYFVLKAHGTAERPETIVLDTGDYGRLIYNNPGYRPFLRAMFLHRTVLFLGFSMTDPDLLSLLQELKVIFEGSVPTHYALMDVSATTKTEQDLLHDNYGVKVIPYIPSSPDHPEVKEFLGLLQERVTRTAVWYQTEELRKAAEIDDPHYRVVATSDRELIVKEKYNGAAEERPLKFSVTVTKEGHKAIQRTRATGEPLDIKREHIIQVEIPDVLSRFFKITEPMSISSGVARSTNKLMVNAVIECADGERASLNTIVLENIQGGDEQMIVSNEAQNVPWKFSQFLNFVNHEATLDFTLNEVGAPIKQALEGLRFQRALAKGGRFHFENTETGAEFSPAEVPPTSMPAPDPLLIKVLESLEFIQKKTHVLFSSPMNVSEAEVDNIFAIEQILGTGRINQDFAVLSFTSYKGPADELETFSTSFMNYLDDQLMLILGKRVFLGPALTFGDKLSIYPEDLGALRGAINNNTLNPNKPVQVRMVPASGGTLEVKFPTWLPRHEAEEIGSLPVVRKAVFNQLVKTLFDASQSETGVLEINTFLGLLDEAKAVGSEAVFLSLSSATGDELVTAFKNLLPNVSDDAKSAYVDGLVNNGWLPSPDAVGFGH
jgi:hypothetical protein